MFCRARSHFETLRTVKLVCDRKVADKSSSYRDVEINWATKSSICHRKAKIRLVGVHFNSRRLLQHIRAIADMIIARLLSPEKCDTVFNFTSLTINGLCVASSTHPMLRLFLPRFEKLLVCVFCLFSFFRQLLEKNLVHGMAESKTERYQQILWMNSFLLEHTVPRMIFVRNETKSLAAMLTVGLSSGDGFQIIFASLVKKVAQYLCFFQLYLLNNHKHLTSQGCCIFFIRFYELISKWWTAANILLSHAGKRKKNAKFWESFLICNVTTNTEYCACFCLADMHATRIIH